MLNSFHCQRQQLKRSVLSHLCTHTVHIRKQKGDTSPLSCNFHDVQREVVTRL